ncbi:MAG: ACP S-malonyltransferase [Cellvibrionaceae bacterium]|nr:ACP S-malonyltransferase [Cellvibrionaceae bacterium]
MSNNNNIAYIFPGQGSQKVGMLSELAAAYPAVAATFAEASAVLGYDLWHKVSVGPDTELNQTEMTQPALLTASIAAWRVWQQVSPFRPAYLAGHSLGEWSALVASRVIAFPEALRLVRLRGKFMQEALPEGEGAMAAIIGLQDDLVEKACHLAEQDHPGMVVAAVNYNSPGQLVIAGNKLAVGTAASQALELGAKRVLPLPVSAPFHTSLMKGAAEKLAAEMRSTKFSVPEIPIIHNVSKAEERDPNQIRELMITQIYSPVPWVDCVHSLRARGVDTLVECGPGRVLLGLCKRIDRKLRLLNVETPSSFESTTEALAELVPQV